MPRRGVALLLVLGCLVLLTTLILAFLITGQNNLKSSKLYANGASVKTLADSTVSLVMAQVQQATSNGTTVAWASQPGMIRTYDNNGKPLTNYRLFSWDAPTVSGTYTASSDATQLSSSATTTWYNSPSMFVDLNQPVADSVGTLHFPILDGNPSDLTSYQNPAGNQVNTYQINGVTPGIEGFWVNLPNVAGGPAVSASNNSIPMPVKWLYVLKDGTVVVPQAGAPGPGGAITTATITPATPGNPIVGRIAYWTDDETSKVNINTASEGVYWDTPRADSTFDENNLAEDQPAQNEFQRYPGHPATTCLSTVLGALPQFSVSHTGSSYTASQFMPYFALSPKLNVGSTTQTSNLGSNAGTQPPVNNVGTKNVAGQGALTYKNDRLYNSIDELAFQSDLPNGLGSSLPGGSGAADTSNYARTSTSNGVNNLLATYSSASSTVAPLFLEKARFFLTASSRAPDVNLFNQPRIGIWPLTTPTNTANLPSVRTPLDNTIAFCGTIGGLPYYFQRQNAYSTSVDLPLSYTAGDTGLDRNRQLTTYLQDVTSSPIPGFGQGTFLNKYKNGDRDQVLTEIFDYVRSQNLEDPNVTTQFATTPTWSGGDSYLGSTLFTSHCGIGQVVPIIDSNGNGGNGTRGFGRFPTITEATLMFIVLGWNDNSGGKPTTSDPNYWQPSGTNTIPPIIPTSWTAHLTNWGCPWGYYGGNTTATPNVAAVNCTAYLTGPGATTTTPIQPGHVRVQAALILSFFDPSQAFPVNNPLFQVQITGLKNWMWNSTTMNFPDPALSNWPVCSAVGGVDDARWGGIIDYRLMAQSQGPNNAKGSAQYYPFCSSTIDIPYTSPNLPPPIAFTTGGPITIKMLIPNGTSYTAGTQVAQQITLNFPNGNFPCPLYAGPVCDLADGSSTPDQNNTYDMARWDQRFTQGTAPYSPQSFLMVNNKDVVRSVRFNTDARLIAGLQTVDASSSGVNASYFTSYLGSEAQYLLHSMWLEEGWPFYQATLGQLVNGLTYSTANPTTSPWGGNSGNMGTFMASGYCSTQGAFLGNNNNELGDWDNGIGVAPDGPYINKADEGDFMYWDPTGAGKATIPYYTDWYTQSAVANAGTTFFSPNRMMPSAVMFGSLPTGVKSGIPWQTLLFNPNPAAGNIHPGFGAGSGTQGPNDVPPYASLPPDHLMLDLFTMPVVEPYPISEPLSTAGRINMNYQIVPFTYIERATGVRAVLKSERIVAIPDTDVNVNAAYKNGNGTSNNFSTHNYRLPINLDATLQYFDNYFSTNNDIFRSASQICNISLVPTQDVDGTAISASSFNPTTFWSTHRLTGDNSREKPYADIYPRLTTKSNTFTVHYYVQTLQKIGGSTQTLWNEATDKVTGEYRGSSTFERYIDPNDSRFTTTANDFASNPPTSANNYQGLALDQFYKFRVINARQFAP